MTDGVFTIPLTADLCLEEYERPCAPAASSPGRKAGVSRKAGVETNGSHPSPHTLATVESSVCKVHFVAGPENHMLAEAAGSLLGRLPSPYNPLALCGPPGAGKSHIARGIASHWRSQGRHVVYTNGADFARGFAAALEDQTIAAWRAAHRGASLLVLEDVTQLTGKATATHELLHTLDAVQQQEGQVVLTSCLPPQHVAGLPSALSARLAGGLVVQLSLPGPQARLVLLQRFAELRGIALGTSTARQLADGLSVTPPELYGALAELALECELDSEPITPQRVRAYLAIRRGVVRPGVRSIAAMSAKYFGLKPSELKSSTRRRAVVQARNVAIYLSRQLNGKSLEQLGDYFGGRDHTTILHGYRTIERRSRTDPTIRRALSDLHKMLAHG